MFLPVKIPILKKIKRVFGATEVRTQETARTTEVIMATFLALNFLRSRTVYKPGEKTKLDNFNVQ